jgi:glycosyltransferase involved in cell wall biosynthesis
MRLSIVVPAHNEEERITPFLEAYTGYFNHRYGDDYEMIVVVNGSSDQTARVVREFCDGMSQVRVIEEQAKIGKGGALLLGLKEGQGDVIGYVDADGATPPEAYQDLVDHIEENGIIIASRWMPGADVSPPQPLSRRISSRCFNTLVKVMFGFKISDTQCGAKLMQRDALRKIMPEIGITRWAFDVDLLFQMKRYGYGIREWPTTWHDVTGSKVDIVRASLEMLLAMIRLRLFFSPFKWVIPIYEKTLGRVTHPPDERQVGV